MHAHARLVPRLPCSAEFLLYVQVQQQQQQLTARSTGVTYIIYIKVYRVQAGPASVLATMTPLPRILNSGLNSNLPLIAHGV